MRNGLWKEVLKCKYMRNNCLQACSRGKKASHTWRGILNSRAILRKGVKWTVGNGATVNCWKDWWCGDKAFEDLTLSSSQAAPFWENDINVNNLISVQGSWNETVICDILPPVVASIILNRPSPTSLEPDEPNWKGSADGIFSSASAYDLMSGNQAQGEDWLWLWKLRIPQKLKGFLWCCMHGKLLTNKLRLKRGLSLEATCPFCCKEEDMIHLLRDCFKAKEVWFAIFGRHWYLNMCSKPWKDWIICNSKNKNHFNENLAVYTIFIVTLWAIWKNRNHKVFNNSVNSILDSGRFIMQYSNDIHQAFTLSIVNPKPAFQLISWSLPPAGRLKLNTDGCRRMGGEGGFGGLIRDERGSWVCGYYGKLHSGTSLEAELWALYKGLTVILQKGMNNVIIETDCEQAMKLLEEEPNAKCPFKGMVEDARIIMRGCECTVQHVYKEGNLCADALAKFGATQPEEILVVNEPPAVIREFLVADMIGMSCERA